MDFSHAQALTFKTLDVFTSVPYQGNPLALVTIPSHLSGTIEQHQKQAIAKEFNLSETVFFHESEENIKVSNERVPEWKVDIFTPTDELPFAGHPVIGSAYHLLTSRAIERAVLRTKAGRIPVSLQQPVDGEGMARVLAEIPHDVRLHRRTIGTLGWKSPGLSKIQTLQIAESKAAVFSIVKGMNFVLVQLESLEDLGAVEVSATAHQEKLKELLDEEEGWRVGFAGRYYFVVLDDGGQRGPVQIRTRMMADGIEDPATGSAACALSSFLALRAGASQTFEIIQGVEMGRRSEIAVEVEIGSDSRAVELVRLGGSAVEVMEGTVRV